MVESRLLSSIKKTIRRLEGDRRLLALRKQDTVEVSLDAVEVLRHAEEMFRMTSHPKWEESVRNTRELINKIDRRIILLGRVEGSLDTAMISLKDARNNLEDEEKL